MVAPRGTTAYEHVGYNMRPWKLLQCFLLVFRLFLGFEEFAFGYDDTNREFVEEVLEEAARDDDEPAFAPDTFFHEEERNRVKRDEELRKQQTAHQRLENERIQKEREVSFQKELEKMSATKRKEAKRQQRRDARVVNKVLRANEKGDLYDILGVRNLEWFLYIKPFRIGPFRILLPQLEKFLRPSVKRIRRAYRELARLIHPDKNRDGRAVEAFWAVERAASILGDEIQRAKYDTERRIRQLHHLALQKQRIGHITGIMFRSTRRAFQLLRRICNPTVLPLLVILFLLL